MLVFFNGPQVFKSVVFHLFEGHFYKSKIWYF